MVSESNDPIDSQGKKHSCLFAHTEFLKLVRDFELGWTYISIAQFQLHMLSII